MNEEYLKELQRKEDEKLFLFFDKIVLAYNFVERDQVIKIEHLKGYEGYEDVLKVTFANGRTGYINISANSVSASARELVRYIWTKECTGHIRTEWY